MNKTLLASAALLVLFGGVATAADMRVKAPVRPAADAAYNWSGFYIGGNAGYSSGRAKIDYTTPFVTLERSQNLSGFIGGGQIGYNWQNGAWVYGIEADMAARDRSRQSTFLFPGTVPATTGNPFGSINGDNTAFRTEQGWLGTARARVGQAWSNWLVYGTGGAAFGSTKQSVTETLVAPNQASFRTVSDRDTSVGWTAGAGAQVGLGQWSLGLEYLYVDLGKSKITQPATTNTVVFPADTTTVHDTSHILRFKLDYAIGAAAP
jgi:outer membrane immunogenic protein